MENAPDPSAKGKPPAAPASPPGRVLFRAEALEHYRQRHEQVVLPRFMTGRRAALLWLVALLLVGGTASVAVALRGLLLSSP